MIHNISLHGVVSIEVMPESRVEGTQYKGMPPYYHRKIIVTDREGRDIELDLFGEREGDLELRIDD